MDRKFYWYLEKADVLCCSDNIDDVPGGAWRLPNDLEQWARYEADKTYKLMVLTYWASPLGEPGEASPLLLHRKELRELAIEALDTYMKTLEIDEVLFAYLLCGWHDAVNKVLTPKAGKADTFPPGRRRGAHGPLRMALLDIAKSSDDLSFAAILVALEEKASQGDPIIEKVDRVFEVMKYRHPKKGIKEVEFSTIERDYLPKIRQEVQGCK